MERGNYYWLGIAGVAYVKIRARFDKDFLTCGNPHP